MKLGGKERQGRGWCGGALDTTHIYIYMSLFIYIFVCICIIN